MSIGHIAQIVILGFVLIVSAIVVAGLIVIEAREWIADWKNKEEDESICDCSICNDFYEKDRNDIS